MDKIVVLGRIVNSVGGVLETFVKRSRANEGDDRGGVGGGVLVAKLDVRARVRISCRFGAAVEEKTTNTALDMCSLESMHRAV